jgi:hypothetical protein
MQGPIRAGNPLILGPRIKESLDVLVREEVLLQELIAVHRVLQRLKQTGGRRSGGIGIQRCSGSWKSFHDRGE